MVPNPTADPADRDPRVEEIFADYVTRLEAGDEAREAALAVEQAWHVGC